MNVNRTLISNAKLNLLQNYMSNERQ